MASNVRNLTRYVIVTHEGTLVEDLTIFLEGSSRVIVYCDGSRFEGDLLALESLAKNHGGVAHPVVPPPDFNQKLTVVPPDDPPVDLGGPIGDWSEDQEPIPSLGGGVSLPKGDEDHGPVKEGGQSFSAGHSDPVGERRSWDEDVFAQERKPPRFLLSKERGGAAPLVFRQGHVAVELSPDGEVNPYDAIAGPGLSNDALYVPDLSDHGHTYGFVSGYRPDDPPLPMYSHRDLGNCAIGMPRHAGTTIVGPLRPDTGGVGPFVPDHIMWEEYETAAGRVT